MNNVLVTGGAGFVGSNLCERLLGDPENNVFCLDNLQTGRLSNINKFLKLERFAFVEHNIQEHFDPGIKWDVIYNAACPASPPAYQKNPIDTTKTSVLGILNMLDLATKYKSRIVQFSTSEVYGDPEVHPQVESYRGNVNPVGIRSCYDEGKRCAESLCFDYQRMYGTRVVVIRIFNTYGPKMDPNDGRVISNFIVQALNGDSITVYGDGTQTRSFQYIDDLIEGVVRAAATPDTVIGPINLGNPEEFTVNELAGIVLEKIGSSSRIEHRPLPLDDPTRRRADISTASSLLDGWRPSVSLCEGLDKTIEYFKSFDQ